jgi:SAM-dependent methyltransferase
MKIEEIVNLNNFDTINKGFYARNVTNQGMLISDFYSEAPFPVYSKDDTPQKLFDRSVSNLFLRELKDLIEPGKTFMEVGCGTGQLSNYLGICTLSNIIGVDASIESLKVANKFATTNKINRVTFLRDDILNLSEYKSSSIDYLWCSGVLHHTGDTWRYFDKIAHLVKPGGYIFIGLYNKYGRVLTGIGQIIMKIMGDNIRTQKLIGIVDPILRRIPRDSNKWNAWYRDQYLHPIESWHSANELYNKLVEYDFTLVGSIPDFNLNYNENFDSKIISKEKIYLNKFCMIFVELLMPFTKYGKEGGLFMMIGRKK